MQNTLELESKSKLKFHVIFGPTLSRRTLDLNWLRGGVLWTNSFSKLRNPVLNRFRCTSYYLNRKLDFTSSKCYWGSQYWGCWCSNVSAITSFYFSHYTLATFAQVSWCCELIPPERNSYQNKRRTNSITDLYVCFKPHLHVLKNRHGS